MGGSHEFKYIKRNLESLSAELSDIARSAGVLRPRLVAVTKSGSDEELVALCRLGAEAIGENRPQELHRRGEILRGLGLTAELHEIGSLQTNKVKLILKEATLIHSLDRISLALEIDKQAKKLGIIQNVLIEINSAEEPQKGGIMPNDAFRFYEDVMKETENIRITGLMTMGPADAEGEGIRPYFRLTKRLFDKMNSEYGFGEEATLSMGMSDSYRVATEEGSTLVRVGRRLFVKD